MVVSDQALAAEVGVEILRAGGNAVDAAVAVGYAQAVVNPCCGNLGGGGFMTLRLADGQTAFIDFREAAPKAAGPDTFLDAEGNVDLPRASLDGWRAAGVPGTVAGLEAALSKFGTMKREQVMAPAIRLARDGFVLTRPDADIIATGKAAFRADPALAAVWLRNGEPLQAGDSAGAGGSGDDARRHCEDRTGLLLQRPDSGGDRPGEPAEWRAVQHRRLRRLYGADRRAGRVLYRGYEILTAAPPSAGGIAICEILNILEFYPVGYLGFGSAETVHLMTEAMRHAFVDRNTAIGDPAFVTNPTERLTSKDYAAALRARPSIRIGRRRRRRSRERRRRMKARRPRISPSSTRPAMRSPSPIR